jgi:hypothetical protein
MALTVAVVTPTITVGPEVKMCQLQVTFDNSYPTNGEILDTSGIDMTTITGMTYMGDAKADYGQIIGLVGTRAAGGITTSATATLLVAYWQTDTATSALIEVANTTDLSTHVYTITLWGK